MAPLLSDSCIYFLSLDCSQDCTAGTTYCTSDSGCCPYFSIDTNDCTTQCDSNQHPNSSTFVCQCDQFYTGPNCSSERERQRERQRERERIQRIMYCICLFSQCFGLCYGFV